MTADIQALSKVFKYFSANTFQLSKSFQETEKKFSWLFFTLMKFLSLNDEDAALIMVKVDRESMQKRHEIKRKLKHSISFSFNSSTFIRELFLEAFPQLCWKFNLNYPHVSNRCFTLQLISQLEKIFTEAFLSSPEGRKITFIDTTKLQECLEEN